MSGSDRALRSGPRLTPDALMAFPLLRYLVRIWEAFLVEHHESEHRPRYFRLWFTTAHAAGPRRRTTGVPPEWGGKWGGWVEAASEQAVCSTSRSGRWLGRWG